MKFADPIRPVRTRSAALLVGALSLATFSASCSTNSPRDYVGDAPRSEVGSRAGSYAVATTPADLKRLIAEDLELKEADAVYAGLEAFVGENISRGTAKRAHLIWEDIRPTTMLQYGQGRSVMTGVKQLGNVLGNEGQKEMETAFESLRQGDFEEVQRLRDEPMGIFHPATAAMSRDVRPYAMLADGVLSYRDLATQANPSTNEVQTALDKLAAAQTELAKVGETKGMFLADAAAAQALERAGQIDAAAEYWMRIAESDEFLAQPEVMRSLVAARIKTYGVRMKERLIIEVEAERRAELRARDAEYSAQVAKLQSKHESFDGWARQGFMRAARQMAELSTEDDQQKARLASLAATAESRDAELGRATDQLAVRLGALDVRATGLEAKTSELASQDATMELRVDREVAQLRGQLDEAVSTLRTDQAGLTARADDLERRAAELTDSTAANAGNIDAVKREAQELRGEAAILREQASQLSSETGSLRTDVTRNQRASEDLAAKVSAQDAELAQSLKDLADYHAAVDELTASAGLQEVEGVLDPALPASLSSSADNSEVAATKPGAGRGVMTLPAYLAVHSMQDVFGVDGDMQQLTAFFMPKE